MTFAIGQTLTAADLDSITTASAQAHATGLFTTTSTSYVAGTGGPVLNPFTAPRSGKVWVHFGSTLRGNSGSIAGFMSFEIREGIVSGSGTIVVAASDARMVACPAPSEFRLSRTCLVTGLTPGSQYHIRAMYRSTSGADTALFSNRRLGVVRA